MITLEQIRAARAMLGLSQKTLAEKAGIAIATINNIERGVQTDPKLSTMKAIQGTLEHEGIEFTHDAWGGIGILLKQKRQVARDVATILMVDDNQHDRLLYRNWLTRSPGKYRIVEAESARAGLDRFLEHAPDCVVLDFMLHGADGFQLLMMLQQEKVTLPPIIFISGMHNVILEENARTHGVYRALNKQSLNASLFCNTVQEALQS